MDKMKERLAIGTLILGIVEPSVAEARRDEIVSQIAAVKQCVTVNLSVRQEEDGAFVFYPQKDGGSIGIKVAFLDTPERSFFEIQRYFPAEEPSSETVFDYVFDEGADGIQEEKDYSSPYYSVILSQFLDRYCKSE